MMRGGGRVVLGAALVALSLPSLLAMPDVLAAADARAASRGATRPAGSTTAAPKPAATPAEAPASEASALSYGTVTAVVRKGETTQLELVELFGSPNISSYDSAGIETWVYDRTVTQTDVENRSDTAQSAQGLGVYFKALGAGGARANSRASSTTRTTTSVRSITVVVKFDKNQIVADFSVRASYF